MELEQMHLLWNILISLVFAPILFAIRQNTQEIKRQDILLNKTREEIAKDYVTKVEVKSEMTEVLERFDKLEEKIDRLYEFMYNR